jgi:hypothetical protein
MRNLLLTLFLLFTMAAAMLSLPIAAKAEATIVNPDGSPAIAYQRTLDRSLMPSPDVTVVIHKTIPSECGRACSIGRDIYLGTSFEPDTFLHEMGHQFDYSMSDAERGSFEQLERDPRPWRSPSNSVHEQFAEAYRLCSRYRSMPLTNYSAGYDYPALHFESVCGSIVNEAARDGFTPNPPRHLVTIGDF